MKAYKEKKRFKREYIPVIIAVIILIALIVALVFVLKDNKKDFDIKIDEDINNTEEISVDTKNTKCNNDDASKIKSAAEKVKISYKVEKVNAGTAIDLDAEGMPEVDLYDYGFVVSIQNITEDIYVVVKNDYSDDVFTYHFSDTDNGTKTFDSLATDESVTITFEIKSENSNCKDEVFRKVSITTPIYNYLSETEFCAKNSTLDVCKQFSDRKYDSTEFDEAKKEVEKNKNDKKDKTKKNNWFADNKYLVIIGGSVITVIGVATAWVRIKKRRSKQL